MMREFPYFRGTGGPPESQVKCHRQVGSMNFLDFLTRAERQAFMSAAHEQALAPGARIMAEGEPADHVIVILNCRTCRVFLAGCSS
jgi:hypothetical protein